MDFYYMPASAPSRAVYMLAEAIGAKLNPKLINLAAGEQMRPEYLKINIQHTVPVLVDGDLTICESRAICTYLVEKYGKKEYYPDSPKARAMINQRLYFDMGTLFKKFAEYHFPQFFAKLPADPEKFKAFQEALGLFNTFLEGQKYAAGDSLTVADFCLVASVSSMDAVGYDLSPYPNIVRWFELCKKTIPSYAINQAGVEDFKKIFTLS